jgi:tRNA A37 threonylcarbamoyladenosine synthetase subunit TsaC/SUA5/YrdC
MTAYDAREQLGYSVSVYLDGGPCADSTASTIVDVTGDVPRMLRSGAISLEKLRGVAPGTQDIGES